VDESTISSPVINAILGKVSTGKKNVIAEMLTGVIGITAWDALLFQNPFHIAGAG
jgi:hypothetical protein